MAGPFFKPFKANKQKLFTVETNNSFETNATELELQGQNKLPGYEPKQIDEKPAMKKFEPPTKKEDFPEGQNRIEHTYDNGNKVVFLLLTNGQVARIREGLGSDVEAATMESDGDKASYLTAMMASTVSIDGRGVNMFELKARKMKDYMAIQTAFAELNF